MFHNVFLMYLNVSVMWFYSNLNSVRLMHQLCGENAFIMWFTCGVNVKFFSPLPRQVIFRISPFGDALGCEVCRAKWYAQMNGIK